MRFKALSRRFAGQARVGLEGVLRGDTPGSLGVRGGLHATGSLSTHGARERDGVAWLRNQRTWRLDARLGTVW